MRGGSFTTIGGVTRNSLAKIGTDGTLNGTWNPDANGGVMTLAVSGTDVYVGGSFTTIGGVARNSLAKIGTNGILDATWKPNANFGVNVLLVSGTDIYVGGAFTSIDGIDRGRLARIGMDGILDATWNPPHANNSVLSLLVSGSDVYVGGYFNTIGGVTRNRLVKIGTDGMLDEAWNPKVNGFAVFTLLVSGTDVYVGGFFTTVGAEAQGYFAVLPTSTSTTWSDGAWSPVLPSSSIDAILADDYTTSVNGSFASKDLTVNPSFTLTISEGDMVELAGDLENNGSLLIENNGSLIQTAASPSNSGSGTYTMQREGDDFRGIYNYWSSPVPDATITSVFGSVGRNFHTFGVGIQDWVRANGATVFTPGLGIIATGTANTPNTIVRNFTSNVGFNSGDITFPISINGTGGADDDDWNLVGNPYPSGLGFEGFYASNNTKIGTTAYLWDSDGSDYDAESSEYATITSAGGVSAGGGSTTPSASIASGQGFFVEALANTDITFSNSHRTSSNSSFLRKADWKRLWLNAKMENGAGNQILLAFIPDASEEYDIYDGQKRSQSKFLSLYMPADLGKKEGIKELAIQGLPTLEENRIIPIGLEAKQAGLFTFSIAQLEGLDEATEVRLYDAELDLLTDLKVSDYEVDLSKGTYEDRFSLRFIGEKITGIEDRPKDLGISVYSAGSEIRFQFSLAQSEQAFIGIYDMAGHRLFAQSGEINRLPASFPIPNAGIYIVKVETGKGMLTRKLFID